MTAFADLLAQAQLPETTVPLCLRGDLVARWRELERQLADADTTRPSMAELSQAQVIAEQMQALREQMQASEVTIRLRAMPALEWSRYAGTRPDPPGEGEDREAWRTRWFAWVVELVSRCAIDPEMSAGDVTTLVDRLSGAQWDELSNAAWAVNEGTPKIPFSAAASALTQDIEPR